MSFVNRATWYSSQKNIDSKCAGVKKRCRVKLVFQFPHFVPVNNLRKPSITFSQRKVPAILGNQVWYDLRDRRKLSCLGLKATESSIKKKEIKTLLVELNGYPNIPKNELELSQQKGNCKRFGSSQRKLLHECGSFTALHLHTELTQGLKDVCLFLFCFNGRPRTQGTVLLLSWEPSSPCPPWAAASWVFLARQEHSPIPRMPRNQLT